MAKQPARQTSMLPARGAMAIPLRTGILQRKCACGETPGPTGECEACRQHREAATLQRASSHAGVSNAAPPIVHEVLRAPGQQLDSGTRAFMEPRFGHDFSQVRVHTDGKAADSARSVNAQAYTVGRNVVFGTGQYAPGTSLGNRLLAHELTHVAQQADSHETSSSHLYIGPPDDLLEHQADVTANVINQLDPAIGSRRDVPGASATTMRAFSDLHRTQRGTLQRQEICEPENTGGASEVVYDYENQVCRPPEPDELGLNAPETDPVDGEFWTIPQGVREGAKPVYDDESTRVVVAFRYSSGGYYEVFDLEGTFVESGEPGLEAPLIDPIDLLAGGLTGLGRGLFRGGVRAAVRGTASGAGRGGATALARAGLVATIRVLSQRAITAVRGVFRAIRFRGLLNFTGTTAARMADPARRVPHHILKLAIRFGQRSPDPQGVAGAFRYVIPMTRNGRQYTLEVVLREADQTVLHFLYR
jgi:hypothetical protein